MTGLERLTKALSMLVSQDGTSTTEIKGVFLNRSSTTDVPRLADSQPFFCVVAQGAKDVLVNAHPYRCFPGNYLLCTLGVPISGQVVEASPGKPYFGVSIVLDFNEIASVLRDADLRTPLPKVVDPAISAHALDDELLDAVTRLAELLRKPDQVSFLAPLIMREIYYKLLISDNHALLRRMLDHNTKVQRVLSGLAWLKQNATRNVRMTELARHLNMSTSSMNAWFRDVTSMSPLQFQKQLRLQEARLMMTSENVDVTTASSRVGYDSPSQFNREYKRFFGAPPSYDVKRLRSSSSA